MAVQDIEWEWRGATGDNLNGGGFDDTKGGVDYSQQDAAQVTGANYSTSGIGSTTLTDSDSGGAFTNLLPGNVIYLPTGTNLAPGFYLIDSYIDPNNIVLHEAPDDGVGGVSGAAGRIGGARQFWTEGFFDGAGSLTDADQTHHIKSGQMDVESGLVALNVAGTSNKPIRVIGYADVRGDVCEGDDRPYLRKGGTGSSDHFYISSYWEFENIRLDTVTTLGFRCDNGCSFYNCKFSTRSTGYVFNINGQYTTCTRCEFDGANVGTGGWSCVYVNGNGAGFYKSRFTGCANGNGLRNQKNWLVVSRCVFDGNDVGLYCPAGNHALRVMANTFYGQLSDDIKIESNGSGTIIVDNIFDGSPDGIEATTNDPGIIDYNCWDATIADSDFGKGANAVDGDPSLTDPASNNFTLGTGSNCIGAGMPLPHGLVGTYRGNIGADQESGSGGGGGSPAGFPLSRVVN